jgi:3-hydroxy-9,10-secoandrosta-1,3,5(10)-triene-9,17-dione monooxygenase reductase component
MPTLAVQSDLFRKTCARFATGITVATVSGNNGTPFGLTVNSFTSVSSAPPLVLICIDYRCSILPHFRASSHYGINVLTEEQVELSVRFSQPQLERFEGLDWYAGETGVPLLRKCLARMQCSVSQVVESGDHAILIGEVTHAEYEDGLPLLYFGSAYRRMRM